MLLVNWGSQISPSSSYQGVNLLSNWWALCPMNRIQMWPKAMNLRSRTLLFWQQSLETPSTLRIRQQVPWRDAPSTSQDSYRIKSESELLYPLKSIFQSIVQKKDSLYVTLGAACWLPCSRESWKQEPPKSQAEGRENGAFFKLIRIWQWLDVDVLRIDGDWQVFFVVISWLLWCSELSLSLQ